MKKKYFLNLVLLLISLSYANAQQIQSNYKGAFFDKQGEPIDVATVTITNNTDSLKYLYANTFTGGVFDIVFKKDDSNEYIVTVMSIGYEDLNVNLREFRGRIVLKDKYINLDDVVVAGKRDVKVDVGKQGGVLYDIGNTYLSNIGSSTTLLNYIPGLEVTNKGDIKVIAAEGDVKVYINDIPLQEKQKLLTLKSEDIQSVEIIRSPGARYKNAGAVILIKTKKTLDGFSSQVGLDVDIDLEGYLNWTPQVDISYSKNKLSVSGSYQYNDGKWNTIGYLDRKISSESFPGNWDFIDSINTKTWEKQHWYNVVVSYDILDKHKLVFEYSGSNLLGDDINSTRETISKGGEKAYENIINKTTDKYMNQNKLHLFYSGDLSDNVSFESNFDYSNLRNNNLYNNIWNEKDEILFTEKKDEFNQDVKSVVNAYMFDFIFDNSIGDNHSLGYGAEVSYVGENVVSDISNNYNNSDYRLNSFFIKAIIEYSVVVKKKLSLNIGFNYMYSYLNDNLSSVSKNNYHSVIPYFSMTYRQKDFSVRGSFRYYDNQPTAGYLDESTVIVVSPYEITRGNRNLRNSISTTSDLYFSYKDFGIGMMHQYKKQAFTSSQIVENNGEYPLVVNTYNNYKKPLNDVYLYLDYMKEVAFWNFSIYGNLKYTRGNIEQQKDVFDEISGLSAQISMRNRFTLPRNFYLQLNGSYRTSGYIFTQFFEPMYSLYFIAEKQFFDNKLNVKIEVMGLVSNKFQINSIKAFGVDEYSSYYNSFYRGLNLSVVWRFNNYKQVQRTKDNEYIKMFE